MNVTPLHDHVIVLRVKEDQTLESGIVLPAGQHEKPEQGVVIAAGPGRMNDYGSRLPMSVQRGDTVLFGKFSGQSIKLGPNEFLVMRDADIFGVVTDNQGEAANG